MNIAYLNQKTAIETSARQCRPVVLAAADVLEQQGFSPALHMRVVAQDISQLCFHMCFIQLTFRGIPARVERRNTLSMELFEQAYTPAVTTINI